ncbi:ribonuclease III domain-containing protein [Lactarius hatsudake]|nr:ribonuclease III domain-containing protein [Lactarius hatsudake]
MPPLSTAEHTPTPSSSSNLPVIVPNTLPLLPEIQSTQIRERIFTHGSLTARRRGEFEAPRDNPSRDNEELAHIGDQVVSLAVTDLIQGHYPRLRVGPTSKLRDRIKCGDALAEIAVQYGLHESLRTQAPSLKASQSVQVDVFKAYVGGIFREQGMDVVKQWLDPLFGPLLDDAYRDERRDHLVVGPAASATTPRTPNSGRKRRRASLQDGASGDADAPHSGSTDRPTSVSPRHRSPATAGLAERGSRKRRRSR